MKAFLPAFFCAFWALSGCVAPSQVMVNPNNGATVDCSTMGWGWAGAPMAMISHEQCKERYRALGFVTAEEFKAQGGTVKASSPGILRFTSDPPGATLWGGPSADQMKALLGKTTPMEGKMPPGKHYWVAECFQVTLDGYTPSEIICRPVESGDRILHFKLKPLRAAAAE